MNPEINEIFQTIIDILNQSTKDLIFDEKTHRYTYQGNQVYSISTILRQITNYAFEEVPENLMRWKARIGTMTHTLGEILFQNKSITFEEYYRKVDPLNWWEKEYRETASGYFKAMLRFWYDYQPNFFASEIKFYDPKLNMAGIIDCLEYDTKLQTFEVVDYKTSAKIDEKYQPIQLTAYGDSVNNLLQQKVFTRGKLVQLKKDGSYKIYRYVLDDYNGKWKLLKDNFENNIRPVMESKK